MSALALIGHLQTLGIMRYVRGELAAANAAWIEAVELARAEATLAGFDQRNRFLCSESWTNGIGHIALLDFFAKRKLLGLCDDHYTVLLKPNMVANKYYLDLWRKYFPIVAAPSVYPDDVRLREDYPMVLALDGAWLPFMDTVYEIERRWIASNRAPLLAMPQKDIDRGWDFLATLGIPRDRWFVTIHVRENGAVSGTKSDFSSIRNASLGDYAPAVAAIVEAGGHPIRIGKLKTSVDVPGLIDLGAAADWLDIFLISQCRFFMGMNSGPAWVAGTFGIPALLTNWAPRAVRYGYRDAVFMPKSLQRKSDGALVDKTDGHEMHAIESAEILDRYGVISVDNAPHEIKAAALSFMARVGLTT